MDRLTDILTQARQAHADRDWATAASQFGGVAIDRLTADDLALSYYRGEEIDLSPLVREQTILALPTRPLCDPECRGLCPRCGASRNEEDCGCVVDAGDPRLAVFRSLKMSG